MNIRQLEIFRAIFMSGTTTGAAHELRISQPAVSKMLVHTETILGFQLFERKKGKLIPTEEAKRLFSEIEPLFLSLRSVQERIEDIRDGKTGLLRLVATPSLASSLLPKALLAFRQRWPNIQISLDTRRTEHVIEYIEHNIAEIGLTINFYGHPSIQTLPLRAGQMGCIMPKGHPLANQEQIALADLSDHPLITLTHDTPLGTQIANAFANADLPYKWSIETRYCATIGSLVAGGAGIGIVDEFITQTSEFKDLVFRPLVPKIPATIYLLLPQHRPVSNLAKTFVDMVTELTKDDRNWQ